MRHVPSLLFLTLCLGTLISACGLGGDDRTEKLTRRVDVQWHNAPARIDLKSFGGGCVPLEFSPDSRLLCASWLPSPPVGDYNKIQRRAVVFDMRGDVVRDASDQQGELLRKQAIMFPETAWRHRFADFVQDTNNLRISAWGFARDYSAGVRFLKPADSHLTKGKLELWRFSPTNALEWSVTVPQTVGDSQLDGMAWFLETNGKECVLVAFHGLNGYLFSLRDGQLLDAFTYGKPDSEAEAESRRRKFGLHGDAHEAACFFFAGPVAFDPFGKLLACGDISSRRLRVVSVEQPHRVLFEANTEDNPELPRGGNWRVSCIHFDGNGKYMVVGYTFGGRLTTKAYDPVEIYDTSSWRLVLSINSPDICSAEPPRVSPDGKTMALTRGDWLEIGPFVPQPSTGEK